MIRNYINSVVTLIFLPNASFTKDLSLTINAIEEVSPQINTVTDILDTLDSGFPTILTDGWQNTKGNGYRAYLDSNNILLADEDRIVYFQSPTNTFVTPKGNNYEANYQSQK